MTPWTCSPAQKGNTHEPRALLTLLSPGVQMRGTSLKKAGLGFQKPNFFFKKKKFTVTNMFRLEMPSFTPLHSWDVGLSLFVFVGFWFGGVGFFFFFFPSPNATSLMLAPCGVR